MALLRPMRGLLALVLLMPGVSLAHKVWLLPSQTMLSGSGGWVTVDAAVSNDLFFYTWYPLPLTALVVTAPDGSRLEAQNPWRGKFRSTFELELEQSGTHRVAIDAGLLMAHWEEKGESKRWRGPPADFPQAVPANAEKLQVSFDQFRVESFISVGTTSPIKALGSGLELVPLRHPNDLYVGELAKFCFLLDGKPAAGVPVTIVAGGTRYRDAQDELKFTTDENGAIELRWPAAGMYWLEAATEDQNSPLPQTRHRYATYIGTFEVLTQ